MARRVEKVSVTSSRSLMKKTLERKRRKKQRANKKLMDQVLKTVRVPPIELKLRVASEEWGATHFGDEVHSMYENDLAKDKDGNGGHGDLAATLEQMARMVRGRNGRPIKSAVVHLLLRF